MEASIEQTENTPVQAGSSVSTAEEFVERRDLSINIRDSISSDIFEEAIEPPVQDKENGNDVTHEAIEEVFDEKPEENDNGDLDNFDDADSELKVQDGDLEEVFEKVVEGKRKRLHYLWLDEVPDDNGFSQEEEEEEEEDEDDKINGERQFAVGVTGEDGLNGEEGGVNDEGGLNGENGVNGEVQFYEDLPPEKIIEESSNVLPNLVVKQDAEASNDMNGEDALNGEQQTHEDGDPVKFDDLQTGEVQSQEVHPEIIIEESVESDPVAIVEEESNEIQTGEVQSHEEELPLEEIINESREEDPIVVESSEIENGDVQSNEHEIPHEEIIDESRDMDPIVTESIELQNGDLHSNEEFSNEVIVKESKETDPIVTESIETENGHLQANEEFSVEAITTESRDTDPIITEPNEIDDGELQSNLEVPHEEEITPEPNQTPSSPIFEIDPEIIQSFSSQIPEIINIENTHSEEAPIIEDIFDSSSSSDNDENPATTIPVPVPSVPPVPLRPAGLGSSVSLPDPSTATRSSSLSSYNNHRGSTSTLTSVPTQAQPQRQRQVLTTDEVIVTEPVTEPPDEDDEVREKLMNIRVKFLRLVHRLGQTPHNTVVAQVLYRLGLAEQLRRMSTRPVVSFDRASILAEQLELTGSSSLDFSCTIMLLGKAGVGKSSTINSLFNESRVPIHTFGPGTDTVNLISGNIHGIDLKIIDTPGLSPSLSDSAKNMKILNSVKKFIKNNPPDIVLYFDRLDVQSRDYCDMSLLQSITNVFTPSIWFNAIIVLTHAASAPPEGANGVALSYDMFVTQRTHVVQQNIRQSAGDVRLMNPVSLVENHVACRMNRAGKRVLPNGTVWEPQLLLLSFASKILGEANGLLRLEDGNGRNYGRGGGGGGRRSPPLPYFLSSLLQSRSPVKLPQDEEEDLGDDIDEYDEEGGEEEDEYDDLPPFKRLSREQLGRLSKEQKKAYNDEIEYREKLFYRKQLKEERKRRRYAKKLKEEMKKNNVENKVEREREESETDGPGSLPVPMPDMAIPASFDSDTPSHRYRYLDSDSPWLVRPVLDLHGWDHDVGYEGLSLERLFVVKNKVPVSFSGQVAKDKKESSLQLDVSSSVKHGEGKSSSFSFDVQSAGKDMSYSFKGESRFRNFKRNDTAAGGSITILGDTISGGVKLEDKIAVNKRVKVLMTGGVMTGRGDVASGARVELTVRDKDYPIGRMLSTLALSLVDWHGELAIGGNCQSNLPIGRGSNLVLNGSLNNKGSGQVGIRVNSSDQVGFAIVALVPLFGFVKRLVLGNGYENE